VKNDLPNQLNPIIPNSKAFYRQKLNEHERLLSLSSLLYSFYCSITGSLHVLPDFYLIGAQKAGTTSLFEYLLQHPSIPNNIPKDIRFFDKYYHKGTNWYRQYFPLKLHNYFGKSLQRRNFLVGDGTERYLDHPHAPERIKKLTPNAKLIVLLRNPIDRAYSHYNFNLIRDIETRSFKDALEAEKKTNNEFEKMQRDDSYYNDDYFRHAYLDRSTYVNKLKRWMSVFPKEQFLIIQSEEFFKNPSEVYNKVLKFLGLPKWELAEYKQYKKNPANILPIAPEHRKQLVEYFRPHNQRLYKLIDTIFDWEK